MLSSSKRLFTGMLGSSKGSLEECKAAVRDRYRTVRQQQGIITGMLGSRKGSLQECQAAVRDHYRNVREQ
jgi:hypothetical protein